jgi:pyruvate/2-oxoglutarate dehydrogenase complex dihydrolipoamide acyltransferase (E2) component
MPTQVFMPQLGESVVEGIITKWLKAKGEAVQEFEPLLEINTDKVDTEVPSPTSGILLEILAQPGATVHAGAVLALIGEAGEVVESPVRPAVVQVAPPPAAAAQPALAAPPAAEVGRNRDLGFISPVVAKLASENKIDLFQVKGTGLGGRITKKDILAYLETRPAVQPTVPTAVPAVAPSPAPHMAPQLTPQPVAEFGPGEILPLTPVRRSIAEHMVNSKHTSPHVTTIMEVDMSQVIAHRNANKETFARDGVNLTFTAYFIAAATTALKAYPIVNSSWSEEGIHLHREINFGMATSLGEAGLIVPVLKNADNLSLFGLARAVNDLANRARARQLKPDEVKGGTFTITNHGISGSLFATPIINQPQCGILGVGMIQKRVVVISDKILGDIMAIRPMVYLGLTFDHRILDGAIADYFLGKIVETLQNWR